MFVFNKNMQTLVVVKKL